MMKSILLSERSINIRTLILVFLLTLSYSGQSRGMGFNLEVSNPWSFNNYYQETTKRYGPLGMSPKELTRNEGLLNSLYVPPFNLLSLMYFKTVGRDSDNVAQQILESCKGKLKTELIISCISNGVSIYVKNQPRRTNGITYDGRTFCAIAANLFAKIFNALNIRGARADFLDASWKLPRSLHVVNTLFLTSPTGEVFGYVIDVGNLPFILFPISDPAVRFHTRGGNEITTISTFPEIDFLRARSGEFRPTT
jgi:hypothetical protein